MARSESQRSTPKTWPGSLETLLEHQGEGGALGRQAAATPQRPVVYYSLGEDSPLYALLAYAKSAQTDLTPEERRTVATLAPSIKTETRRSRP